MHISRYISIRSNLRMLQMVREGVDCCNETHASVPIRELGAHKELTNSSQPSWSLDCSTFNFHTTTISPLHMKSLFFILFCLAVMALLSVTHGKPPNPPGQEQWDEQLPRVFTGTYEGTMNTTDIKPGSSPCYFTFAENFVLFQTVNSTFLSMAKVNPKEKRIVLVGLNRDEKPHDMHGAEAQTFTHMCIYNEDGEDRFRLACGRDSKGKSVFPLGFNDTKVQMTQFQMRRPSDNTIPADIEGTYVAEMLKNGTVQGNLLLHFGNSHLTILQKPLKGEYSLFNCHAKFNTTDEPRYIQCHKKVRNGGEAEHMEIIYKFNTTGPGMKSINLAFNKEGDPRPQSFENAQNNIRGWSNRVPHELEGSWFGRVRDLATGMPDTPVTIEFRNTTMIIGTQFFRYIGFFRTQPSRDGQSTMHVIGAETANPKPEKPHSNMKFDASLYVYEVKAVANNNRLLRLCFRDRQKKDQPQKFEPFKCGDKGVEMIELSAERQEKNAVGFSNVAPNFGRAGTKISLNMRIKQSRRRAFGTCENVKVYLDKLECTNLQCDLTNNQVRCEVPTSTKFGPHRISVELNGFTYKTPASFNYVPEDVGSAAAVSGIHPHKLPLSGAPIHIPIRNVDNLSGQAITVMIDEQACGNVTIKGMVVHCIAPAMTAPGEYFVTVQVGSVDAIVSEKILYNSDDHSVKLGPAGPKMIVVEGGQEITLPLFIKDSDGTVPADLVTSVTIAGTECTDITVQEPTGKENKQKFLVKCKSPAASTAGRVDVLFTAVLEGNTYLGKSLITYANADASKNVQIYKIDPKFGATAGGFKLTLHAKVPLTTFAKRIVAEEAPEATVTIGGLPCPVTETKFDKAKGTGTVTCTAPAFAAGTYPVELTFPGGVSITKAKFTFTSDSQPRVSKIEPSRISSTVSGNYTITGSNLVPSSKRRGIFSRMVTALDCTSVTVTLDEESCSNVVCTSSTEITATCSPAVSGGNSALVVSVNGESSPSDSSVTGAGIVEVTSETQPTITSISPTTGTASGGTVLTITGTNFGTSATDLAFTVGGNACTSVSDVTDSSFKCTTPVGVEGDATVQASRAGESSFETTGKFAYTGNADPSDPGTSSAATARVAVGALVASFCLVLFM